MGPASTAAPAPPAARAARVELADAVALSLVLLLPALLAWALDPRTLYGVSVWAKPIKFQLSFALHWATVLALLVCIAPAVRARRGTIGLLRLGVLATVLELLYIVLQAARGRASHFNFETAWESALYYGLMGGAALVIVGVTGALGWLLWRHPAPGLKPGLHLGAALGLGLGALMTLLVTAPMAAGAIDGPGHWVGGVRSDLNGLRLVGWSTTGGDLRVPHFFATHLLQALPLVGWLADRWQPARARRWVAAAAVLGVAWVAATMVQALAGRPFVGGIA